MRLRCALDTGAPPPPHPRALRVPLRPAARVLAVTVCGMSGAWLSREVCLLLRFARVILRAPHANGVRHGVRLTWGRAGFLGRAIASPCGSARAPIPAAPWHLRLNIVRLFATDIGGYDKYMRPLVIGGLSVSEPSFS